jgi:putative endonuclease
MTSDLRARVWQHKNHVFEGSFTDRYDLTLLVWYEWHGTAASAIEREKRIKDWKRGWKVGLIEERNSRWDDLWDEIAGGQLTTVSFRRTPESTARTHERYGPIRSVTVDRPASAADGVSSEQWIPAFAGMTLWVGWSWGRD